MQEGETQTDDIDDYLFRKNKELEKKNYDLISNVLNLKDENTFL